MLHYLVVGGAGFVGFHLTRRLLSRGHKVSVLDDLTGYGAEGNLRDLHDSPGWTLMRHAREDARLRATWSGPMVPRPHAVDRVVWLADAPSRFDRMDLQLRGVDCLIRWALSGQRAPRILVVTGPTQCEAADAAIERAAVTDVRRLRLREVYGPRMPPRAFLQDLLDRVARPGKMVVDPEDQRDLMHVEDAVTAVCRAVDRAEIQLVLEVPGPDVWRAQDLARMLQRRTSSPAEVVAGPKNGGAPAIPDGPPAWRALGWEPARKLSPSLKEVLAWHNDGEDLLAAEYEER